MDRKAWRATVHGVAELNTTEQLSTQSCTYNLLLMAPTVKRPPAMRETWVRFLGREVSLEKAMAIHSSTLAWKIPWTEEPGGLQSMGSQGVGHD